MIWPGPDQYNVFFRILSELTEVSNKSILAKDVLERIRKGLYLYLLVRCMYQLQSPCWLTGTLLFVCGSGGNPSDLILLHISSSINWEWFGLEFVILHSIIFELYIYNNYQIVHGPKSHELFVILYSIQMYMQICQTT
jgi:hypothetical protein